MNLSTKKSRMPARLDLTQSLTGLALALFMAFHLLFDASILLGAPAFDFVSAGLEGEPLFGQRIPVLVTIAAIVIFTIFILHALLAMRKFPSNFAQYRTLREHIRAMRHPDTSLWFVQAYTGFAMFFLGSVHLWIVMTKPETIGAWGSSQRIVDEWMWVFYLLLLLAVVFHAGFGVYRLAVKWGWFEGRDPNRSRKRLRNIAWAVIVFYTLLGLASLGAFVKIGLDGEDHFGNPVEQPPYLMQQPAGAQS
jgi:fumarate reductase subunit C